jgi:hypothetical protein
MRRHPVYACELLSPIPYLRPASDIPYCHHEKWDGTGYPRGLQGEQIPLSARIFAVVDVWDGLRSDRPYRGVWPEEKVHGIDVWKEVYLPMIIRQDEKHGRGQSSAMPPVSGLGQGKYSSERRQLARGGGRTRKLSRIYLAGRRCIVADDARGDAERLEEVLNRQSCFALLDAAGAGVGLVDQHLARFIAQAVDVDLDGRVFRHKGTSDT